MITIGELKEIVNKLNDDEIYDIGINDVFSWRGSYDEPCFSFEKEISGKHMKEVMNRATSEVFTGWKGGDYTYQDYDKCNFELEHGRYSDGEFFLLTMFRNPHSPLLQSIASVIESKTM
jgi:hypothetical protein